MTQSKELLFTYGTLRRGVESPMQRFLTDRTTWLGEATFQGKLYYVGGHPAAIPSSLKKDTVTGDLFEIDGSSDLIRRLDQYEGFDKNNHTASLYIRDKKNVRLNDTTEILDAWIYLFNKGVDGSKQIHSGDYLRYMHK